ncbi:hypothetical protein FWC63_01020 [Candidatus Saccharibacteria bacterium]|nr:hypothetical protein [Candidatus Saccharibacteria bacterium]
MKKNLDEHRNTVRIAMLFLALIGVAIIPSLLTLISYLGEWGIFFRALLDFILMLAVAGILVVAIANVGKQKWRYLIYILIALFIGAQLLSFVF